MPRDPSVGSSGPWHPISAPAFACQVCASKASQAVVFSVSPRLSVVGLSVDLPFMTAVSDLRKPWPTVFPSDP